MLADLSAMAAETMEPSSVVATLLLHCNGIDASTTFTDTQVVTHMSSQQMAVRKLTLRKASSVARLACLRMVHRSPFSRPMTLI